MLLKDGRVFGCGKTSRGELALGPALEFGHLERGIKEFIPLFSLGKVKVYKIFAGCHHSFVIINQNEQSVEQKVSIKEE